ncbi:MAG: hypothetical protein OXC44_08340 [Proteobacteria bacterium]|nr:hypothetical protein [Pseudomonadota bacterium]
MLNKTAAFCSVTIKIFMIVSVLQSKLAYGQEYVLDNVDQVSVEDPSSIGSIENSLFVNYPKELFVAATGSSVGMAAVLAGYPLRVSLHMYKPGRFVTFLSGKRLLGVFATVVGGAVYVRHKWLVEGGSQEDGLFAPSPHSDLKENFVDVDKPSFIPPPVALVGASDLKEEEYNLLEEKYGIGLGHGYKETARQVEYFWTLRRREFIEAYHRVSSVSQAVRHSSIKDRTKTHDRHLRNGGEVSVELSYLLDLYGLVVLVAADKEALSVSKLAEKWSVTEAAIKEDVVRLVQDIRGVVANPDLMYLDRLAQQDNTTAQQFVASFVPSPAMVERLQEVLADKRDVFASHLSSQQLFSQLVDFFMAEVLGEEFLKVGLTADDQLAVEVFFRHIFARRSDEALLAGRYGKSESFVLAFEEQLLDKLKAYWQGKAPLYGNVPLRSFPVVYRAYMKRSYRDDFMDVSQYLDAVALPADSGQVYPSLLAEFVADHLKKDPYWHYLFAMLVLDLSGYDKELAQSALARRFHRSAGDVLHDKAALIRQLRLFFIEEFKTVQHHSQKHHQRRTSSRLVFYPSSSTFEASRAVSPHFEEDYDVLYARYFKDMELEGYYSRKEMVDLVKRFYQEHIQGDVYLQDLYLDMVVRDHTERLSPEAKEYFASSYAKTFEEMKADREALIDSLHSYGVAYFKKSHHP